MLNEDPKKETAGNINYFKSLSFNKFHINNEKNKKEAEEEEEEKKEEQTSNS